MVQAQRRQLYGLSTTWRILDVMDLCIKNKSTKRLYLLSADLFYRSQDIWIKKISFSYVVLIKPLC